MCQGLCLVLELWLGLVEPEHSGFEETRPWA